MRKTILLAVGLVMAVVTTGPPAVSAGQPKPLADRLQTPLPGLYKVAPRLWHDTDAGRHTSFLVVLQEQADLSAAGQLGHKVAKSRYVYDALRSVALRSQAPIRAWLDSRGIAYKPHYLVNMLTVAGDRALLLALAERPEVARLEANPMVEGVDPMENAPALSGIPAGTRPDAVEWGVRFVKAPGVWNRYDVRGQGIVIGGQDTGYDWTHAAIQRQYRGWSEEAVDHNYNWHDAFGGNSSCPDPSVPCDDNGHGTHTMGTMIGDDGVTNQIGVAPGAKWIGCRNMDSGNGTPDSYTECFEFLLAPYPQDGDALLEGDPAGGAHIVNNSWYCPPSEGCSLDSLQQVVENMRAAGVMVVASAGNNGSACSSVLYPIGLYDSVFSVGAVDSVGNLAAFSSRGPVTVDGSGRMKPDITAPGVAVRSAHLNGAYRSLQGTSMASPHVAGVVALLWSAEPSLVGQIQDTEAILTQTADHVASDTCGSSGWPNNTYGWGYVDALAAVELTKQPAKVQGRILTNQVVCNSADDTPLAGAELGFTHVETGETIAVIAADGTFSVTVPSGPYEITVTHPDSGRMASQSTRLVGYKANDVTFAAQRCVYLPVGGTSPTVQGGVLVLPVSAGAPASNRC